MVQMKDESVDKNVNVECSVWREICNDDFMIFLINLGKKLEII